MPTQSQYAQVSDITSLALTPQAAARFGDTAITAQLQAASSTADSYLASAFVLPLQTDPQGWDMQLTRCVCAIAAFNLYRQFGINPNSPDFPALRSLYDDAIGWLEEVRDEEIVPQYVDSEGTPGNVEEGGPFVITATSRGYSERGLSGCTPPMVNTGPFSDD